MEYNSAAKLLAAAESSSSAAKVPHAPVVTI